MRNLILCAIYRDIQRWRAAVFGSINPRTGRRVYHEIKNAANNIVAMDLVDWLGHDPTVAERKSVSRAIENLAAEGLLVRHGGRFGARTVAVGLTRAGIELAQQLEKENAA